MRATPGWRNSDGTEPSGFSLPLPRFLAYAFCLVSMWACMRDWVGPPAKGLAALRLLCLVLTGFVLVPWLGNLSGILSRISLVFSVYRSGFDFRFRLLPSLPAAPHPVVDSLVLDLAGAFRVGLANLGRRGWYRTGSLPESDSGLFYRWPLGSGTVTGRLLSKCSN